MLISNKLPHSIDLPLFFISPVNVLTAVQQGEKSVRKNVSVTAFEYVCSLMIHYKCILTFLRTSVQLAHLSVARKLQLLATN